MVPPADFISSDVAWNRVKSPSAKSFTFDILKTPLLQPVMNKGKPSWSIFKKTPIRLNLLAIPDLIRFAKLSIAAIMSITSLGHRGLALSFGRPYWWDFKCIAVCFIDLEQVQTTKPKFQPDFFIIIEQVLWTCYRRGGSSGSCTCPIWLCVHDLYSVPICKKVIRAFYWAPV